MKKLIAIFLSLTITYILITSLSQAKEIIKKPSQKQKTQQKKQNVSNLGGLPEIIKIEPVITATEPEDMSEIGNPPSKISVIFNQVPYSVKINVVDSEGTIIDGTVSKDPGNARMVNFVPKKPLINGKDYTISVTPPGYMFSFGIKKQTDAIDSDTNKSSGTNVLGYISQDTIWKKSGNPYITLGNVVVKEGVTLTIEPGVIVYFDSNHTLIVDGKLIARGTQEEKIKFITKNKKEPGSWGGILFEDSSTDAKFDDKGNYLDGCILQHCGIVFSGTGIKGVSASPFLDHCVIWSNENGIDILNGENVRMQNSVFAGNTGKAIFIENAKSISLIGNTISDNNQKYSYSYGVPSKADYDGVYVKADDLIINDNVIIRNTKGVRAECKSANITNNVINNNQSGGGISIKTESAHIDGNSVSWNKKTRSELFGAGIYIQCNSATITNNLLIGNEIYKDKNTGINSINAGGGIFVNSDSCDLKHNTIMGNKTFGYSSVGGGAYISGETVNVTDNKFIGNETRIKGGGMCIESPSIDIADNTLIGNQAYSGSGISVSPFSTIGKLDEGSRIIIGFTKTDKKNLVSDGFTSIRNNRLINNVSDLSDGGAICVVGGNSEIIQNVVNKNIANYASGGIVIQDSPGAIGTVISKNIISQNEHKSTKYANPNSIAIHYIGNGEISDNLIAGNISDESAAVYIKGRPRFYNNTIIDNKTKYDLFCDIPKNESDFDAINNYWGKLSDVEIHSRVHDSFQNNELAVVNVVPFLTESPVKYGIPIEKPNIRLTAADLDFENVAVGNFIERSFTIYNDGNSTLIINSIVSSDPAFMVASPLFPHNVSSGQKIHITIKFSPDQDKHYIDILAIDSNDHNTSKTYIAIHGIGQKMWKLKVISTPPDANVSANGQSLGKTPNDFNLPAGCYILNLTKDGYNSIENAVIIEDGKSWQWNARMYKLPPKTIIGKDGADMILIPSGDFAMGDDRSDEDFGPNHEVYIDGFYIDKYEVTNAKYRNFVKATKYREPEEEYNDQKNFKPWGDSNFNGDNYPVVYVSWEDAKAYAEWAGKRLPTEAEWEKASRSPISENRENAASLGNYSGSYDVWWLKDKWKYTSPVGSFVPLECGLYDMGGNVMEWCADWYDASYYQYSPRQNPKGPDSGQDRVIRGTAFSSSYDDHYSIPRYQGEPSTKGIYLGFRCAMDVPKQYNNYSWASSRFTENSD